uniref:Uncharacterized protein n=1 Tax=viral metagenome TaxID=1070528 RepID=A0A6C0BII0_9ZZZZ
MEPATLEMSEFGSVSVIFGFTLVIGAIGFVSYSLAKTFKDFIRIRAESHEILETEVLPADLPETLDLSDNVLTNDDVDDEEDEDAGAPKTEDNEDEEILLKAEEEDDVVDMSIEDDSDDESPVDPYIVLRVDIDSLQERIDNISAELQEYRATSDKNIHSMVDANDNKIKELNSLVDKHATLVESTMNKLVGTLNTEIPNLHTELSSLRERMGALETNLSFAKVSIEQCKYENSNHLTESEISRMISSALDAKKSVPPADLVKTADLDKVDKRTQIQKTVYQAWNGNAKWVGTSEFPEGSLFIQMIRKRFMTKEQNEDWLSTDNKKIATYNRDSLLGLSDENWSTHDHKVHTKRYYKDDWDTALDISITITYSKDEPFISKNKNSTILRFLHSNGKIEWDNLLVNI